MHLGDLDRSVVLQRATVTHDAFNAEVVTWVDLARVSASKRDVSDGERVKAAEVGAVITTRFTIHHSAQVRDINAKDQLLFEGRPYDIQNVREIGRGERLEISAVARAD